MHIERIPAVGRLGQLVFQCFPVAQACAIQRLRQDQRQDIVPCQSLREPCRHARLGVVCSSRMVSTFSVMLNGGLRRQISPRFRMHACPV